MPEISPPPPTPNISAITQTTHPDWLKRRRRRWWRGGRKRKMKSWMATRRHLVASGQEGWQERSGRADRSAPLREKKKLGSSWCTGGDFSSDVCGTARGEARSRRCLWDSVVRGDLLLPSDPCVRDSTQTHTQTARQVDSSRGLETWRDRKTTAHRSFFFFSFNVSKNLEKSSLAKKYFSTFIFNSQGDFFFFIFFYGVTFYSVNHRCYYPKRLKVWHASLKKHESPR